MIQKVYLNGDLIEIKKATIEISNASFLHGVGLFETLRAYQGRVFKATDHIERLKASADKLNIPLGDAVSQIDGAITAVLEANELTDARVRITVTPSVQPDAPQDSTLLVTAQETSGYPTELYERGMTVFIFDQFRQFARDPLVGHKTTSYLPRLLALREAQNKHCGEALWFTPDNLLAEGSISNVFLVRDGSLTTPLLATPVLPGITRAAVLELAVQLNIPADETSSTIDDLLGADEVFLTNAIMEIMPVTRVERRAIGSATAGPITTQLAEAYRGLTRAGSQT